MNVITERRLTDKLDAVLLEEMRTVFAHVPSGDLNEFGNVLDTYHASARAHHERHAGGQVARSRTDVKCSGAVQ